MFLSVSASAGLITSRLSRTSYPSGGTPPIHMPLRLEAAILSRMRSPVTSRSNCANESRTFSVRRPIEVVVKRVVDDDEVAADSGQGSFDRSGKTKRPGPALPEGRFLPLTRKCFYEISDQLKIRFR